VIVDRHFALADPTVARDIINLIEYGGYPAVRRDCITLNAPLREALLELAAFSRERPGTSAGRSPVTVQTVTAAEFADREGVSKRAITARCKRGTLPAELTPRGWIIFDQEEA
jgi:hypothetical protein